MSDSGRDEGWLIGHRRIPYPGAAGGGDGSVCLQIGDFAQIGRSRALAGASYPVGSSIGQSSFPAATRTRNLMPRRRRTPMCRSRALFDQGDRSLRCRTPPEIANSFAWLAGPKWGQDALVSGRPRAKQRVTSARMRASALRAASRAGSHLGQNKSRSSARYTTGTNPQIAVINRAYPSTLADTIP